MINVLFSFPSHFLQITPNSGFENAYNIEKYPVDDNFEDHIIFNGYLNPISLPAFSLRNVPQRNYNNIIKSTINKPHNSTVNQRELIRK